MSARGKLTPGQVNYLEVLAGPPNPTQFAWMSKRKGKIVPAEGSSENWTHFRITAHWPDGGKRIATLPQELHDDLWKRGLTAACAITDKGRAALSRALGAKTDG